MVQLFFILLSYNEGMICTWRIFSLALLVLKTNDLNDLVIYLTVLFLILFLLYISYDRYLP